MTSTSANAQGRYRGRVVIVRPYRPFFHPYYPGPFYNRYGYYNQYVFSSSEAAENQGYHDGFNTGRSDARHGRSYNPERSHYFQDAGFGNFAEAFRDGFVRGYRDGFGAS
jgi:hypothetical protein